MIIKPGLNELMKIEGVNSRYELVIGVSKRARKLARNEASPLVEAKKDKFVSTAVEEMVAGKVKISSESEG